MNIQELVEVILDHIRGMWRYRWHAVLLAWGLACVGWYMVFTMPSIYEASARVSVDTNSLLPTLTEGLTASENLISEVDLVSKALITRGNIEAVANSTGILQRAQTEDDVEFLISSLQRRVRVSGGNDMIFNISFEDTDRSKARQFVANLLDRFVESSLGAQDDDADITERAIAMEIEDHESRLRQAESDLAEFKKNNIGYMPDDGRDYYGRLQAALADVASTERQIRQLREKRNEIARQIEGEEPVFGLMPVTQAEVNASCSQSGSISQMQGELSLLLVDYTEKHPRVTKLRETIEVMERQCQVELASMSMSATTSPATSLEQNPVYQNLRMQLSNAEVDLAALQEKLETGKAQVTQLRADVDKIAMVETGLKRLNRDYSVIETRHQELLRRWETLQSKKRLDPVTNKVQFIILEPPFASARPVAPNRTVMLAAVLVFSLGAGVAIAFALNQLRPVFFARQAIYSVTGLPVLGSVSMVMSSSAVAARRRAMALWFGSVGVLIGFTAVFILFEPRIVAIVASVMSGGTA
jgi:polysaccharide chain length determinant protein (PEP-CTERM system associated)